MIIIFNNVVAFARWFSLKFDIYLKSININICENGIHIQIDYKNVSAKLLPNWERKVDSTVHFVCCWFSSTNGTTVTNWIFFF